MQAIYDVGNDVQVFVTGFGSIIPSGGGGRNAFIGQWAIQMPIAAWESRQYPILLEMWMNHHRDEITIANPSVAYFDADDAGDIRLNRGPNEGYVVVMYTPGNVRMYDTDSRDMSPQGEAANELHLILEALMAEQEDDAERYMGLLDLLSDYGYSYIDEMLVNKDWIRRRIQSLINSHDDEDDDE